MTTVEHPLLAPADERDGGHRRVVLAHLPTPVEPLDRLAAALGLPAGRLVAKRDDATGLALGGNKVRKLEYICAAALASGAQHLVTAGLAQSNHGRQTAAAASRLGLGCTLLFDGAPPHAYSGNLVLDALFGANIRWITAEGDATAADYLDREVFAEAERLTAAGTPAYPIVVGGSVLVGTLGYVRAARELRAQVPDLAQVFCPAGSAGTQAGLAAGLGNHGMVRGIQVGGRVGLPEKVEGLAAEAAALVDLPAPRGRATVDDRLGFAAHSAETLEAIRLAARTEGLVLDPVYSGKAMAGLIAAARAGELPADGTIVFLHTGGAVGLLSNDHARWLVDSLAAADR